MLKILQAHLLRAFVANLKIYAIYAFYPESICDKNLAVRKVFAFSDSEEKRERVGAEQIIIWDANYCQENSTSLFLTYRLHYSNIAKIASLQIL